MSFKNTITKLITNLVLLVVLKSTEGAEFSYADQNDWDLEFPKCGLYRQSPIELWNPSYTVKQSLPKLHFNNYNRYLSTPLWYHNTGYTINVSPAKRRTLPTISGKHLRGTYEFEQFHFHWGSKNSVGSEHIIGGKRYGLELHLVHRNKKYSTFDEAIKFRDGVLVIGLLYKVDNVFKSFNYGLGNLLFNFKLLKFSNDVTTYATIRLQDFLRNVDLNNYFLYYGSLTTPPCNQAVTWIVMRDIQKASSFQLQFLRNLVNSNGESLSNNYRNLQDIGTRNVFLNH